MLADADGVAGTAAENPTFEDPVALDRLGDGWAFPSNVLVAGSGLRDEATGTLGRDGVSFN